MDMIHHVSKIKEKKTMINSIDTQNEFDKIKHSFVTQNEFDKIKHSFVINTLSTLGINSVFLSFMRAPTENL